ncbi:MAG: DUF1724 domain-containing protein [Syntrophomonas sp.]|nr:DUF1724 domain-containing protein [Syntrophomonas sp.]
MGRATLMVDWWAWLWIMLTRFPLTGWCDDLWRFNRGGHGFERIQAITTERIIQELRQRGSYALRDASLHSRMELHCRNDINLHLIVTEYHLFLALPRPDGTLDLQNIIVSRNQEALNWGRMLFYYVLSGAEKVDLATF